MKGRVTLLIVDDPLGERLDLLAINEYEGWYGSRGIPGTTKELSSARIDAGRIPE
jgi:hypothetical protein